MIKGKINREGVKKREDIDQEMQIKINKFKIIAD